MCVGETFCESWLASTFRRVFHTFMQFASSFTREALCCMHKSLTVALRDCARNVYVQLFMFLINICSLLCK